MAQDKQCAQALLESRARWDTLRRPGCRFRPESARADGGDNRRGPLRPGRFAARDRAGYRRLDGGVGWQELIKARMMGSLHEAPGMALLLQLAVNARAHRGRGHDRAGLPYTPIQKFHRWIREVSMLTDRRQEDEEVRTKAKQ